ncbi:hypothetical protein L209DRAFT_407650 [Thermothelomyces heterothallicus CBS 203.75]
MEPITLLRQLIESSPADLVCRVGVPPALRSGVHVRVPLPIRPVRMRGLGAASGINPPLVGPEAFPSSVSPSSQTLGGGE